uniref:Cytochrome c oxidase subunit 2 n=1 Tax=Pectinatella magnifica TaxID=350071 RepID=A0A344AUW9_9BILA|nr:cytochrome c oxidase subunit II [Pectinatella magnifica]AWX65966.1 cytochrome c oxidase subunit 2 [Pectinatella magnifica]
MDMPNWYQILPQEGLSPLMGQLVQFHDYTLFVITLIMTIVGAGAISLVGNRYINSDKFSAHLVETIWTILPAVILVLLALPSLRILYLMDEIKTPLITLKAIGHQWYWSYEYSDFSNVEFDSYMVASEDLQKGEFRLLDVDHRVVLPTNENIRVLITAADVLHSWTVPSLGVKADAVPGRLNQLSFLVNRPSILYGQCSELCGANHSFMPIVVEATPLTSFLKWFSQN